MEFSTAFVNKSEEKVENTVNLQTFFLLTSLNIFSIITTCKAKRLYRSVVFHLKKGEKRRYFCAYYAERRV